MPNTWPSYHRSRYSPVLPHHDGGDCAACHQHGRGFSTFTTVLNTILRKLYAFVAGDYAYASPPAWSGNKPTALPPGLQNHSLNAHAVANGLMRFRATVTISNEPVAQTQSGQAAIKDDIIMYYHNDHLGTPLFLTDEVGSIVWRREQKPFGETSYERGGVTENLRFPGQYWDAETGLAQNWHRDYAATLGRYVEADPIGIDGGINRYGYSVNNPLGAIDPSGLRPLDYCEKKLLSPYIPAVDLNSADLHIGLPGWMNLYENIFGDGNVVGVTRGNDIYLKSYDQTDYLSIALLGHELVHVGQYSEGMTWASYLAEVTKNGYRHNKFEEPAYSLEFIIRFDLLRTGYKGCVCTDDRADRG